MAAEKCKKKKMFWQKFVAFLNVCYPRTHLFKALNSLYSSRPNGRLSQNPKRGDFREFDMVKNIISFLAEL